MNVYAVCQSKALHLKTIARSPAELEQADGGQLQNQFSRILQIGKTRIAGG